MEAKGIKALVGMKSKGIKGTVMALFNILAYLFNTDPAYPADSSGKVFVYKFF